MGKVLLVALLGVVLGGCSARQIGFVDYVGDVATATANGFATGGPVGGVVGLVVGLITGKVTRRPVERRERAAVAKVDRREKVIAAYQRRNGLLPAEEFIRITTKTKEPDHAHP